MFAFLAQVVHRQWLTSNGLRHRIFGHIRRRMIQVADPLVRCTLYGAEFWLPLSHDLPLGLKKVPHYTTNLARLARYMVAKYPDLAAIDIGANIGDSVALFRSEAGFPILCLEGDPQYFALLQKNTAQFPDVEIGQVYVGDVTGTIMARSNRTRGTAQLVKSDQSLPVMRLSDVLAGHPRFARAKLLKVDTDGFDGRVIRGSIDYLAAARPAVFFEYDPYFLAQQDDDGLSIFQTLQTCGYAAGLVWDNRGDYLLRCDLSHHNLLEDLHAYASGRRSSFYYDIACFHAEDADLLAAARECERAFFHQIRPN